MEMDVWAAELHCRTRRQNRITVQSLQTASLSGHVPTDTLLSVGSHGHHTGSRGTLRGLSSLDRGLLVSLLLPFSFTVLNTRESRTAPSHRTWNVPLIPFSKKPQHGF